MCGVIGFIDKKKQLSASERKTLMNKMLNEIIYRGRDALGIYENNGVVIGHNRLAILDLSERANQPLSTNDGNFVISYNGEIFNHLEMRENEFKYETNSDTETLLHAYKTHGKKSLELIRGMFAVSFYEPILNRIMLSVDRFGIKPLYYLNTEDWFAWSSELKVFKYLKGFNFSLNEDCLYEYGTFRVIAGSEMLLEGIHKLTPSEIIEYDINKDSISQQRYRGYEDGSDKNSLEELLRQSVSEHMLSDVQVGFQLSGGLDSSLISALAKNILKQKDVHSFSIGLENPQWNEFKYSREISKLLGTKHHEVVFDQNYFCKNYPIATYHLDEPIAYPNTVPLMLLSNVAANHVKVLLSGEGADELFGGYNRYRNVLLGNGNNKSIVYSNSFSNDTDVRSFFRINKPKIEYRELLVNSMGEKSVMQKLGNYDTATFLPSLLLRQDKMGMSSTIENRFPFLDPRLVDFALDLPDLQKVNGLDSKIILKALASKYLPSHIVSRKKCGFGLPISEWLRDPCGLGKYLQLLMDPKTEREYLNYPNIHKCIDEHLKHEKDNSEIIWILLSLELWVKIFIESENPERIWSSFN